MKHRLIDSNGHPVPAWMAAMLSRVGTVTEPGDTFWADMRARTTILVADLTKVEQDADRLLLDVTRLQMQIGGEL
jgi:hypothetical protein